MENQIKGTTCNKFLNQNSICMKTYLSSTALIALACLSLLSFAPRPGAHSFRVFVDNKLVVERYVTGDLKVQTIHVPSADSRIDVHYSECGRTVSGRKLTAKDEQGKVLKTWAYDGKSSGLEESMLLRAKDLEPLEGYREKGLKIFYSSIDFPEGVHIFSVARGGTTVSLN
jgi:hypothetical protein